MWLNINQILKLYVDFEEKGKGEGEGEGEWEEDGKKEGEGEGEEEGKGEREGEEGNIKIKSEQTAYDRDDVKH